MPTVDHHGNAAGVEQRSLTDAASGLSVSPEDRPARNDLDEPAGRPIDLWTGLVSMAWVALPAVRGLGTNRPRVSDRAWRIPEDVASAVVGAARAGDAMLLRDLLRPDPQRNETTWTVACFQIGDLAPSAIRDFADPVAAVLQFAGCGEPMHVAAELVASDSGGSRWTALVRTGDRLVFQLFSDSSAESASSSGSSVVGAVRLRWAERLAASARRQAMHDGAVRSGVVHDGAALGTGASGGSGHLRAGGSCGGGWELASAWGTTGLHIDSTSGSDGGMDLAGWGWRRTGTAGPSGGLRKTPGPGLPREAGDLRGELEALGRLADATVRRLGDLAGPRSVRRPRGPRSASERPTPSVVSSGPTHVVTSAGLASAETPSVSDAPNAENRAGPAGSSRARSAAGCTDWDRSSMAR